MMPRTPRASSAGDLLRGYDHGALIQIAREHALDYKGKGKEALVKPLAKRLYTREAVAAALTELEPSERALLDLLILARGEAAASVIRDQLLAEGVIDRPPVSTWGTLAPGAEGSPTARGSRKFADIVARLGALGLAFSADGEHVTKMRKLGTVGKYLFIPDAVLQHLPRVEIALEASQPPPEERRGDPEAFLRDLYLLLSFAQKQPIPLISTGQIAKRSLVQIDTSFRQPEGAARVKSEADLDRLPLLRALSEELGLLMRTGQGLQLGEAPLRFLSRPRGERQRIVYEAYCRTQKWSELALLRQVILSPRERMYSPEMVAARKRVLEEVARLPVGEWISIQQFLDVMRKRAFEFLLPRDWSPPSRAYYGYPSYGYSSTPYGGMNPLLIMFTLKGTEGGEPDWETIEAEVIRAMVTGPLYWMGLVDLGSPRDESPSTFRITPDGALLLHGGTPSSAVPNPNVVIQPNFQIFAFEPTGEDVLFTLDRMAERVRMEQVAEYHLTRESVYAAQRDGMEAADILGFLERVSSVPIPQNVRRSLEEWGAQLDRIVVRRNVSLLQGVDDKTLDALYADPQLSHILGRRIAPTAALVPSDQLPAVYSLLLNRTDANGWILPALTEGDDGLIYRAVTVHADGHITFRQRLPSIYVRAALQPFTEEVQDGSLRLTPGSLQRAANARNGRVQSFSADQILDRLARMSMEPLPDEVTVLVRRWAKDWGRGELTEVTLLRVENEETMKELQADDEIGRYLQAIPGAPTLATVRRNQADKVRAILLERGMDLQDGAVTSSKK